MTEAANLTADLVRIDSVNPMLDPRRTGEAPLARFVRDWAVDRGVAVTWLEATPGRPSLVLRSGAPRDAQAGTLLLNAHLDTVGVAGMDEPFTPRIEAGRLMARGAMDMKASLAACLSTVARAATQRRDGRLRGEVILTAVADEEHDSIGTRETLAWLRDRGVHPAMAIVTEPTDLTLHVAHRGFAVVDVTLHGRASHTSQPEAGINAVTHLGRLLTAVERADAALRRVEPHARLGYGGWQAVLAAGGRELFTTPDRATVSLERRTLPGENAATGAEGEVRAWLRALQAEDAAVHAEVVTTVAREAFECDVRSDRAVQTVLASARAVLGTVPAMRGAPYWTDAALVAAAGIPTVLFGPVGGAIHQPGEWVDVASIDTLRAVLDVVSDRIAQ